MIETKWARENVAAAQRLLLATYELALIKRAEIDAKIARLEVAHELDDLSVLRDDERAEIEALMAEEETS